jgi:metal-responsive CopG/Arc/MetJ family transcriptional regulator
MAIVPTRVMTVKFSVALSAEQLLRLDAAVRAAGVSRSRYVREHLENHLSTYVAKPSLQGPGLDEGAGTYVKKISVGLSSLENLKQLDEIVEIEKTQRSRFTREFIDSLVD